MEGKYYEALADLIVDVPLFPFGVIKGPVVRITPSVTWVEGKAQMQDKPRMTWYRVSPYDIWWTPGVSDIAEAAVIERVRLTRSNINQLLGLPGYNEVAFRAVLRDYGSRGYVMRLHRLVADRARQAGKPEDPRMNESGIIEMLEYHGYVQGKLLHGLRARRRDRSPIPTRITSATSTKSGATLLRLRSVRPSANARLTTLRSLRRCPVRS